MDYRIEKMDAFRIVGLKLHTTTENGQGWRIYRPFKQAPGLPGACYAFIHFSVCRSIKNKEAVSGLETVSPIYHIKPRYPAPCVAFPHEFAAAPDTRIDSRSRKEY